MSQDDYRDAFGFVAPLRTTMNSHAHFRTLLERSKSQTIDDSI
jgi:hypothetical protein